VEPANLPGAAEDWCAFFVGAQQPDTFSAEQQDALADETVQFRHETLPLRLTFYGPRSMTIASRFSDGLQLAQNRDLLRAQGFSAASSEDLVRVPELVKNHWYQRTDLLLLLGRVIIRRYAVRSLVSASGDLNNERYTTPIEVTNE